MKVCLPRALPKVCKVASLLSSRHVALAGRFSAPSCSRPCSQRAPRPRAPALRPPGGVAEASHRVAWAEAKPVRAARRRRPLVVRARAGAKVALPVREASLALAAERALAGPWVAEAR
jgi:hypothetical protein